MKTVFFKLLLGCVCLLLCMDGAAQDEVRKKNAEENLRVIKLNRDLKKLDEFLRQHGPVDANSDKRVMEIIRKSETGIYERVLLSTYLRDNYDKLTPEKQHELMVKVFGEVGISQLKKFGFDPDIYFTSDDLSKRVSFRVTRPLETSTLLFLTVRMSI